MASIRKRGDSYLLVVSMGYDHNGKRQAARQETVKPPDGLSPKQKEKRLYERAVLFGKECKERPRKSITLEEYVKIWLRNVAPDKLAKIPLVRHTRHQGYNDSLPHLQKIFLVRNSRRECASVLFNKQIFFIILFFKDRFQVICKQADKPFNAWP